MAIPQIISANQGQYEVLDDSASIQLGLVQGMIRDSATGSRPSANVVVESARADLFVRVEQNRWFGISGRADVAFPNLSSQSDIINLTMHAPGYQTVHFSLVIPQNAAFPIFSPDVVLNPEPVRLEGRVTVADTTRSPIRDALIRAVDPVGAPQPERIHLLRRPVQISRSAGATAQPQVLSPFALAGERCLVSAAVAGSRAFLISNRQGLAQGQVLHLGSMRDGEFTVIESISALPANLSWPGLVNLHGGLQGGFPEQTPFEIFTTAATGPAFSLLQPVSAGASVLVLDGRVTSGVVELTAPGQAPEYHRIGAMTDSTGYYRIDGVGSVPLLHLDAGAAGFQPLPEPVPWVVLYEKSPNQVDFQLVPLAP